MLKPNMVVFVLGILIGSADGYVIASLADDGAREGDVTLQNQLNSMSRQLSASLSQDQLEIGDNSHAGLGFTHARNEENLIDVFSAIVQDRIDSALGELKQEIRDDISLQIAQIVPMDKTTTIDSAPEQALAQVSEETRAAAEQTDALLASAIDKGHWDQADQKLFNDSITQLSGEHLADAYRKLSAAINNGDILVSEDVSLF